MLVLYKLLTSNFLPDSSSEEFLSSCQVCPVSSSFTIFLVGYSWILLLCISGVGNANFPFADGGYNKWNTEIQGERQKSSLQLFSEASATGKGLKLA